MATFGDLVVRLGLDKTKFDSGITAARGSLTKLKSIAVPAAAAVVAVGGAFTAAAIAVKEFVAPSFEALDTLGDLSSRLGVATDKLAALQYAAGLSGIEQESLTMAIGKYLDTLSNAVNGTKSAQKAFGDLGLTSAELRELELDQQFVAVANALANVKNPADRVRMAMDLFGKSGAQMLQLLNDGGQNLIATFEEAHAVGIAPTAAEVAKIQMANDAIDRMNAAWKGVANTVAIEVAPAVENFANTITSKIPLAVAAVENLSDVWDRFVTSNTAAFLTMKELFSGSLVSMTDPFPEQTIMSRFQQILSKLKRMKTAGQGFAAEVAPDAPLLESSKGSPLAAIGPKSLIGGAGGPKGAKEFPAGKTPATGLGGMVIPPPAFGGLGGFPGSIAPAAPLVDIFENGIALDTRKSAGAKDIERRSGQLRESIAPGGMKGAQDTLSRILRSGGHTKDPNAAPIKATEKNTAAMVKSLKKLVDNNDGGLMVGAAKAGL